MADDEVRRRLIALLPEVRGFARFLAGQQADADDLVQEALTRALSSLDRFAPGTEMRAWLFTITRNVFYEQYRRRRTEARAIDVAHDGDTEVLPPSQAARLEMADLQRGLFTLSPLLREALILVGAQGLSYDEAAAICGVPTGTVKARVSRARRQLADALQRPQQSSE